MNTHNLSTRPDKPVYLVRDGWELVSRLLEFTAIRAAVPVLLARGKSLPMRFARVQSARVHGPSSTHREEGEQS
ncbi:hypothetical protein WDA79_08600 [Streptomyces sp. A475]|uniref:hypothetical protein n=1 Tax=Streptomyces sp. A475 TaxID=3131976 RepID=UPI0030C8D5BF